MNTSKLNVLNGLKIIDAEVTEEKSTGISFENDIKLWIYNEAKLIGSKENKINLLIGTNIEQIYADIYTITIKFHNGLALVINMNEQAYTGPEAMQLFVPGKPIVIWN